MAIAATLTLADIKGGYTITANGKYLIKGIGPYYGAEYNTIYINDGITGGQWGSATAQLQATPTSDNSAEAEDLALDITDASLTADGYLNCTIRASAYILNVTGGTAPKLRLDIL